MLGAAARLNWVQAWPYRTLSLEHTLNEASEHNKTRCRGYTLKMAETWRSGNVGVGGQSLCAQPITGRREPWEAGGSSGR